MLFEKHLNLKSTAILFLGIIPFTIGSDCDIVSNSFSYIKGEVYNEILLSIVVMLKSLLNAIFLVKFRKCKY